MTKEFVLKNHKTLHAISLIVLIGSFLVQNFTLKLVFTTLACAGMAIVFNVTNKKIFVLIMIILIAVSWIAAIFYYQSTL